MIDALKRAGVRRTVMVGGIARPRFFREFRPDARALAVIARVGKLRDDLVLRAVASELESEGIAVVESTLYLQEIVPRAGVLGARPPSAEEWRDIRFGFRAAKVIGQFDIGQSGGGRGGAVIAVEGLEGTDATIRRAGLRTAVVGVGYLGRFHAEKYAAHRDAELVGVVDVDPGRAREVAAALGVRAFTDHRALAGRVDCASVAVPTQHHFEVARDLLAAGVDVLVEKPVTTTVEEAKALVEFAVRGERVFQVGHLERFNPAVLALEGLVTQPRFIECHRLAPFTERGADVDVVLDLMIHDLDVILSMVQSPLRSVEAVGVPVLTPSVDIANARLRFANGCIANVTASRVSLKRERKLRIFQADAYLAVDHGERRVRICRREPDADGQAALTLEEREVPEGDALELEVAAFLRAVRGREAPPVSGWDGLRALEVVQVIRESLATEVRAAQASLQG